MPMSENGILRVAQNCRSVFVSFHIKANPASLRTESSTRAEKVFVWIPKRTGIVGDDGSNFCVRDEMQVLVVDKYEF